MPSAPQQVHLLHLSMFPGMAISHQPHRQTQFHLKLRQTELVSPRQRLGRAIGPVQVSIFLRSRAASLLFADDFHQLCPRLLALNPPPTCISHPSLKSPPGDHIPMQPLALSHLTLIQPSDVQVAKRCMQITARHTCSDVDRN